MTQEEIRKYAREWKQRNRWRYRLHFESWTMQNIAVLLHDKEFYQEEIDRQAKGYRKGWDKGVVKARLLKRFKRILCGK